jgi:hypothetical protein
MVTEIGTNVLQVNDALMNPVGRAAGGIKATMDKGTPKRPPNFNGGLGEL